MSNDDEMKSRERILMIVAYSMERTDGKKGKKRKMKSMPI